MVVKHERLPDTLYQVSVPIISTYSEFELETLGIPITEHTNGRKEFTEYEMTVVYLPLTRIIDIYATGVPIQLVVRSKLPEIYKILEEYLRGSGPAVMSFNATKYQEEREYDIDRFAEEMFGLNRYAITNSVVNKKSGFDIGLRKMPIPGVGVKNRNSSSSVLDSYAKQNHGINIRQPGVDYITHNDTHVDPATLVRRPHVVKRQKIKPKGDE